MRDDFGYAIPTETTGEFWAVSAHPNGPAKVINGKHKGKSLAELWEINRELFGHQAGDTFPLLTKIIDAKDDLSVQVHPDDEYGLKNEGELGKTECWYILDAEPEAEIILGHHAESSEEFQLLIDNGEWDNLLRSVKVKAGGFFYVPSGTVHAIGSGVLILETQQSSDTTYRLYGYNRKDENGNLRELHIKQSVDVTKIPHKDQVVNMAGEEFGNSTIKTLISNEFFSVYEWIVTGSLPLTQKGLYTMVSVVDGNGEIYHKGKMYEIKKGDNFLLPHKIEQREIKGNLKMMGDFIINLATRNMITIFLVDLVKEVL